VVTHADDVAAHRANNLLQTIATDLDALDPAATDADQLRRAHRHVDVMVAALATSSDLDLVSLRDLETAAEHLDLANGAMEADLSATLLELEEALDAFHPAVLTPVLSPGLSKKDAAAIADGVRKFRKRLADAKAEIKALGDAGVARQAALQESLDQIETNIADAASEIEVNLTALVAPLKSELADLSTTIDTQTARLDTAISTHQTQFTEAEAKRASDFDERRKTFLDEHAAALKRQAAAAETASAAASDRANAVLEALTKHEADARRLVSRTGSDAMSGGFLSDADAQAHEANRWRWIGVGAFGLLIVLGLLTTHLTDPLLFNFEWLAGRLLVAVPLLAVGSYALQQSGMHRRAEREARAKELDFNAVDPYLELIQEPQKSELKAELARKAFFREQVAPKTADDSTTVIEKLLDIVKEAVARK
jgi:hypothetical protein